MCDVLKFTGKFKNKEDDMCLKVIHGFGKCQHKHIAISEDLDYVECVDCGEKLNPLWVLKMLANEENAWIRNRDRYVEEMKRLKERKRTKCKHCGKMTEISKN